MSVAVAFAVVALGCVPPDAEDAVLAGPPCGPGGADFQPVSAVLEKRCGTLDCHGSTFRPLRIYGQTGLRLPVPPERWNNSFGGYAGYSTGGGVKTTPDELVANYQGAVLLEPEIMTLVMDRQVYPEELTLMRKPRLLEKHKGGQIFDAKSAGYICMTNWLSAGRAVNGKSPPFDSLPCGDELKGQ
jgi:hypothetical protein